MTPKHHRQVKTWPEPFAAVKRGEKRHEFRRDDRNYQAGDTIELAEWDPIRQAFTGDSVLVLVTYKTPAGSFGVPEGFCVLSIWCDGNLLPAVPLVPAVAPL